MNMWTQGFIKRATQDDDDDEAFFGDTQPRSTKTPQGGLQAKAAAKRVARDKERNTKAYQRQRKPIMDARTQPGMLDKVNWSRGLAYGVPLLLGGMAMGGKAAGPLLGLAGFGLGASNILPGMGTIYNWVGKGPQMHKQVANYLKGAVPNDYSPDTAPQGATNPYDTVAADKDLLYQLQHNDKFREQFMKHKASDYYYAPQLLQDMRDKAHNQNVIDSWGTGLKNVANMFGAGL